MPQFAVETFSSQIFWLLIGFFIVWGFLSFFVVPNLQQTLESREQHVGSIVQKAETLSSQAKKVEQNAEDALEKVEIESAAMESKLIASFHDQSVREKDDLNRIFSDESQRESTILLGSSEKCFKEIADDMDGILETIWRKIEPSSSSFVGGKENF